MWAPWTRTTTSSATTSAPSWPARRTRRRPATRAAPAEISRAHPEIVRERLAATPRRRQGGESPTSPAATRLVDPRSLLSDECMALGPRAPERDRRHRGRLLRRNEVALLAPSSGEECGGASPRPPSGVYLFLSLFAVSRQFSQRPSCHLALFPLSSLVVLSRFAKSMKIFSFLRDILHMFM